MKSILLTFFALAVISLAGIFTAQAQEKRTGYNKSQPEQASFVSTTVVINEVYGGAGCGTAGCSTYQNDFIELRNIGTTLVNIGGWSVQYAAATGTAWQITAIPAGTVLRPGDRYLIAESFGANGVNPLPTPNVTGTIAMSATAAKIALVNNSTALTGACPFPNASIIDFVGYGTTAACNGSGVNNTATNAPAPSTTTSDQRNGAGADTDVDSTDFAALAPTPQAALLPTAASATLQGRVITSDGSGISKANVVLIDSAGVSRTVLTSSFGYFTFEELPTGQTYTISVQKKLYQFNPATRAITLNEDLTDFEFRAEP
ncbi:MAG TPA: lamin tail domain-containing protein [Pyrinomonadaceae bacterium]|jgi:hypothetical protein